MEKQIGIGVAAGQTRAWRLLSINEAAERLGVCRRSIELRIGRKELKTVRIGRRVLILEGDLMGFVQKRVA